MERRNRETRSWYAQGLEPLEMFIGVATLFYGLWMWLPLDTFDQSISYSLMAAMAPEWLWGATITTVGGCQVLATACHHRLPFSRLLCLWLLVMLWSFLALLFGVATGGHSGGVPLFSCFALAASWCYWRLAEWHLPALQIARRLGLTPSWLQWKKHPLFSLR